ncbi:hypothetical protein [Dactylosporangium sp. NPDC000521]|uniref:hypothetical protein n=1 Tax=Dactylosporangium sp. NPDC000521 TaxID=3363975 RepID=UPI0036BEF638
MYVVAEHTVLAAAGDDPRIYRLPLVTYVLGRDRLVLLLEPGDHPTAPVSRTPRT